jgi:hypothetical protein
VAPGCQTQKLNYLMEIVSPGWLWFGPTESIRSGAVFSPGLLKRSRRKCNAAFNGS